MSQAEFMNIIATFVIVCSCGWFGWSWLMSVIERHDEQRDRERGKGMTIILVIGDEQPEEQERSK